MTRSKKPELSSGKSRTNDAGPPRLKPGPKPRPIVEYPEPLVADWTECDTFHEALSQQMERHGENCWHLYRSILRPGDRFDRKTLRDWAAGRKMPNTVSSLEMLGRIEHRYRLPDGYLRSKVDVIGRAPARHNLPFLSTSERRRLSWHLPDDFDRRPAAEKSQILEWIRTTMVSGSTEYRRYQAEAMKVRYALRFPPLDAMRSSCRVGRSRPHSDNARRPSAELVGELAELIRFKTSTFTDAGMHRRGVWNDETASQKIEHLGLMFGALAADPCGPVRGRGVPVQQLTLALLAFPAVWDWYLQWRQERRGFFTSWELNMLSLGLSLVGKPTGWLRQMPHIAERLAPIPGLLAAEEVDNARRDWNGICEIAQRHGLARFKEIARVARVHRDPFEPILPILEDENPVGAYRQITLEVLRRMPDRKRYPRTAAEVARSFLMLRFGLHLGVRQKNLRQLLVCPRTAIPRTERQLERLGRGELRWSVREEGWEVLIPSNAFKNSNSSFFGRQPFRLLLPDLDGLYGHIADFIGDHRGRLLNGAPDPGTFFVKTVKRTSQDASYNSATFYEAWRLIIQRYGIYNPYTGRGAIKGLLPHGPHNVRDVLATHVLKRTGSYEQASYAIQDTPEMVAQHYGRFLPQHKRTKLEIMRANLREIGQERFTGIDRRLLRVIDADGLVSPHNLDGIEQSLRAGRLATLGRLGLAVEERKGRWRLSDELEPILRAMGKRGDIIATLDREVRARELTAAPADYAIYDPAAGNVQPIVGRIAARGLSDEQTGREYLIVDGVDGRAHYVEVGVVGVEHAREGAIVRINPTAVTVRDVDRTVAEIAAANAGRYSEDIHFLHDPTASERFVQTHVRRLEAIRRSTGVVAREPDGSWKIAADHLERALEYERQRVAREPVRIEPLAAMALEQMPAHDGITWLDEDASASHAHGAPGSFGSKVAHALRRRQQWLVEQGLADRPGRLDVLRRRELQRVAGQLSRELGAPFAEAESGLPIEGTYRRSVQVGMMRMAVIENSREFTLVPWRPVLERQIGKEVSGIMRGRDVSWTFGRQRSGPEI